MEIQGKIIKVFEARSGQSERGLWMSQDFLLEVEHRSDWKTKMVFSVMGQDRLQRFAIKEGQDVNVSFDIDAHEYNGRWFNSVRAFDVRQRTTSAQTSEAPTSNNDPFGEGGNPTPFE